jgi:hypothetical protein
MRELAVLYTHLDKRDFLARQVMIILEAIREEIDDDPRLFENPAAKVWLSNFGLLMEWCATGDASQLPKELYPVIEAIEGKPVEIGYPDAEGETFGETV